ncbi:MAG TPA: hypothetical protein VEB40_07635, partial [Flavipsychrobacter sp.]|nr:hypothetical protein [Flavipsychrobacter sp.]
MKQTERKKRDRVLLLLLLLFLVAATGIYFHFFPYDSISKPNSVSPVSSDVRRRDSAVFRTADSGSNLMVDTFAKIHIDKSDTASGPFGKIAVSNKKEEKDADEADNDDYDVEDLSPEELKKIIGKKKELLSVSEDEDVLALYDPQRKTLNVRPVNSEWSTMYLIYPNPDYKAVLRRNLIFPDFEGLVYPDYKKGQLSYNGGKQDAV